MAIETSGTKSTWKEMQDLIPSLSKGVALFLFILNVIFPGLGTALLCCIGGQWNSKHLLIGFLQFVFAVCFIGWLWSIFWGILFIIKSK